MASWDVLFEIMFDFDVSDSDFIFTDEMMVTSWKLEYLYFMDRKWSCNLWPFTALSYSSITCRSYTNWDQQAAHVTMHIVEDLRIRSYRTIFSPGSINISVSWPNHHLICKLSLRVWGWKVRIKNIISADILGIHIELYLQRKRKVFDGIVYKFFFWGWRPSGLL